MWRCSPWALLPPLFSVLTAAGLWIVYFVAVHDMRIEPLGSKYTREKRPPFISVAGNYAPASCIFSEVMNLAAFLGFMIGVLRYVQLKNYSVKPWLNVCSLVTFSLGCFGMTLVGNFQVFAEMAVHNAGTFMTFGLGTLFCWIQSYVTLVVNIKNEGRTVGIIRFVLAASITISMITHFSLVAQKLFMQGAQCQWALVMFFLLFIGTFAVEFRHIRFHIVCTENCRGPESGSGVLTEVPMYHPDQL
ncbi:transmembrane protein 150C [Halichoeres trimaculatus]|uniref:transmembrane protein 150C n=1 Tax=Halichoeres trimaculatus TaxID=147232 RepID=UPI003D9F9FBE